MHYRALLENTLTKRFRCIAKGPFPVTRGRYHGGRRPLSDDTFHSPTVIPPSALDKPSIMKLCHRRRTCSHTSPRRSSTMVTLRDTRFVECRCWNDGWTVKCRHLTVVGLYDTGPRSAALEADTASTWPTSSPGGHRIRLAN